MNTMDPVPTMQRGFYVRNTYKDGKLVSSEPCTEEEALASGAPILHPYPMEDSLESPLVIQYDPTAKVNLDRPTRKSSHGPAKRFAAQTAVSRGRTAPFVANREKISRNAYCPCGSTKKFKRCCLAPQPIPPS